MLAGSGGAASLATQLVVRPAHHVDRLHAVGWASSNWSGYAQALASGTYSKIVGNWTVPSVAATSKATYSAAWAGIDGFNNSSLIQTGTEQDYYNGSAHYAAWWTTSALGFAEQVIPNTVNHGDYLTATIANTSPGNWTITLQDITQNWTFSQAVTGYTGPANNADWIIEAPGLCSTFRCTTATLAHYSSPTPFTSERTAINGGSLGSPGLIPSQGGELIQKHKVVSIPSAPNTAKDAFNMANGSTAPSAP